MGLVALCLQILPLLLLALGLGGVLGVIGLGPRELPRAAALNRWLGAAFILMAAGLLLYSTSRPVVAEVGLGLALAAVVLYTLLFRQVRRQYPPTVASLQDRLKSRYRFKDDPESGPSKPDQQR